MKSRLCCLCALCAALIACDSPAAPVAPGVVVEESIPADQSGAALTLNKKFFVAYEPSINPIPFNKIFTIKVTVSDPADRAKLLSDVKLDDVRITMPAHGHGMKVKHTVEPGDKPGVFIVRGVQLHMNGEGDHGRWRFEFVVNDGATIDQASFDVQCCRG